MDIKNFEYYLRDGLPLPGATVKLFAASNTQPNTGTVLQQTLTNSQGMWQFLGLAEADYDVSVELPGIQQIHWYKGLSRSSGGLAGVQSWVSRKNRILNGGFRVNQRGSSTADNGYALDRWRLLVAGSSAATPAQITSPFTLDSSHYALRLTCGPTPNQKFGIFQVIEGKDIWDLRGGNASLQFKAQATSGISDVRAAVVGWTGTEDATTADPINAWGAAGTIPTYTPTGPGWANCNTPVNLNVALTPGGTYKIERIPIPSNVTNLAVFIWCDDTTTSGSDTLDITDVQLEKGDVCTQIDRRLYAEELERCLRYYEALGGVSLAVFGTGMATSTTVGTLQITYLVPKTYAPSINTGVAGSYRLVNPGGSDLTVTAVTPANITPRNCVLNLTVASGLTAKDAIEAYANDGGAWIQITADV